MLNTLHKAAAITALGTIATFWLSTVVSELFLGQAVVTMVKTAIPYGFLLLVPALMAAGVSGMRLAKGRRGGLIGAKRGRMPYLAANGVLILIPAALFLSFRAQAGNFDAGFYIVQALELAAGAANVTLLALNLRDGRRLTAGRRR